MAVIAHGADYKAFYQDASLWVDSDGHSSWYVEDEMLTVNGNTRQSMDDIYELYGERLERLPDDAQVRIDDGTVFWQGQGRPPEGENGRELSAVFAQWQQQRSSYQVVASLSVPRSASPEAIASLRRTLEQLGAVVQGLPAAPKPAARPKP